MSRSPWSAADKPVRPMEVSACAAESCAAAADPAEEAEELEFKEEEHQEGGTRKPAHVRDPKLPSQEEVEEHALTHLPYRAWCCHCVRGKGRSMQHRSLNEKPGIPEIHVDFCFMGKAEDERPKCIVVAKDRETRMIMCTVTPVKGGGHEFPARRIRAFINELGYEHADIAMKSDQEPAILDLVREVARIRIPAKTVMDQSPVGSSASNGAIERGVQTAEGQIRVLKDALQARIREEIKSDHPVLAWLVEFAAVLVNRYEVGHDGKTPYERSRGKRSKLLGLEFGELVNFRKSPTQGKLAKLESLWDDGVFLGYRSSSGEVIVGTKGGIFRTRTVQRKAKENRWDKNNLDLVGGVPWKTSREEEVDENVMPTIVVPMQYNDDIPKPRVQEAEYIPRRLYIKKGDVEKYGMTPRCKGCLAAMRGAAATAHSEECRRRMTDEIGKTEPGKDRVQQAKARMQEFEDRATKARKTEAHAQASSSASAPSASSAAAPAGTSAPTMDVDKAQGDKRGRGDDADDGSWEELAAHLARKSALRTERVRRGEKEDQDMDVESVECLEVQCEEHGIESEYRDSRTGEPLDGKKVKEARAEEIKELERRVYVVADISECWEKTGKSPIQVRWVDVRKGEGVYRSRLVAKDFKTNNWPEDMGSLYAAMPPLELVKLLFVEAVASGRKVMLIDIGKAHLYAPVQGDVFVDLPPERAEPGKCARLLFTLYGMRTAASSWEKEYSNTLQEAGFEVGKANTCAFWHPERRAAVVVHGDDFVVSGAEGDLKYVEEVLRKKYPVKMRGTLGPDAKDQKEAVILNRKVYWTKKGVEFEADTTHVQKILEEMGMEDCNESQVPGAQREETADSEHDGLDPEGAWKYRSVVARANYLAQDRPDIRFAVKELCRRMSAPTTQDWQALKKLCRYLRGRPRMRQSMNPKENDDGVMDVYVDSDWAGCRATRRSTNGGVLMVKGLCLKTWSSTQTVVARSSGEAEYYAAAKGAAEAIGFQSMCRDLGIELKIKVWSDSSACRGMCQRTGIGKVKHMAVQMLWLQDAVRKRLLDLGAVRGACNPADLMTKHLTRLKIDEHMTCLSFCNVPLCG